MRIIFAVLIAFFLVSESNGEICGYKVVGDLSFIRDDKLVASFKTGIADSDEKRRRGLMFCTSLSKRTGLLFTFEEIGPKAFWMKNTMIPLGIIFISHDLKVLSVKKGQPYSLNRIIERGSAKYVFEINFAESSVILPGDEVKFVKNIRD